MVYASYVEVCEGPCKLTYFCFLSDLSSHLETIQVKRQREPGENEVWGKASGLHSELFSGTPKSAGRSLPTIL